jgi:hypothetical protein
MDVHKGSCNSTDPDSLSGSGPANSTELTSNFQFQHWQKSETWSLSTLWWWINHVCIHSNHNSNGKVQSSSPPHQTTENSHNAVRRLWKWCTSYTSPTRHILVVFTLCHLMAPLRVHIMWHYYMIECDLLRVRNIQNCRNMGQFCFRAKQQAKLAAGLGVQTQWHTIPYSLCCPHMITFYIFLGWGGDFTLSVWIC